MTLEQRISESMFGRIALATLDDDTLAAMVDVVNQNGIRPCPYLVAVIRRDMIEGIAASLGIEW